MLMFIPMLPRYCVVSLTDGKMGFSFGLPMGRCSIQGMLLGIVFARS